MISNLASSNVNVRDMVMESSISLSRNFSNYLFADKMRLEEARALADTILCVICSKEMEEEFTIIKLWECTDSKLKILLDRNIITDKTIKRKDRAAVILNREQTLFIIINEEDHIRIKCTTDDLDLIELYEYANEIDNLIEEDMSYAFDETLGYLTSSIENVGTGLKAEVKMHLPVMSLSEEAPNIVNRLSKVGINVESASKKADSSLDKVYNISNQVTLGLKEIDIINNLEEVVTNLASDENRFRETFNDKYKYELEDRIFRAYGILKNAKLLKEKEMADLLSYVRLGSEISLLDLNKNKLDRLLIETKDSVIQNHYERELSNVELNLIRADIAKQVI